MAIIGIGVQPTTQLAPRASQSRENLSKNAAQLGISADKTNAQTTDNKAAPFAAVPATASSSQATSSRKDLVELERNRNSFQLQQKNQKSASKSGRALQSFLDVADFERKDKLTNLYGIDIFI